MSIAKIEKFPVFFGVTDKPEDQDLYAIMEWFMEKNTGLIQLNSLIPLDILYQDQHAYASVIHGKHITRVFFLYKGSTSPENVFEIGGGQGRIASIL